MLHTELYSDPFSACFRLVLTDPILRILFPLDFKNSSFRSDQKGMVLPLLKLGTLALKTLSKPVANRLKHQAVLHPRFRQFIINIAQANHRTTTRMQRRIYSHATNVEIRPLNEEKAVQAAVDLFGELFLFMVAVIALIFEVQRNARSEARKEEMRRQELEAIRQRNEELAKEVELLNHKLQEVEKLARAKGLGGIFHFKHAEAQNWKSAKAA
ncbi:Optic atrophy 3 protein (OPA3) [Quillaja saponaria]|uniref:Optic atrophy 3 protein (OPA3) n=1 Tax=Quillaja saponaria TaxID=32244 RepID=A0AAD7M2T6_QUISA|nr:Optic atrophy 3 protein (OPA3) [Quillaja saponaria]